MWMIFVKSFRKNLTEVFGIDEKDAKEITKKAKVKYR